jgi:hypothetical protein
VSKGPEAVRLHSYSVFVSVLVGCVRFGGDGDEAARRWVVWVLMIHLIARAAGDDQPFDKVCADLDSACENQVCGAGE